MGITMETRKKETSVLRGSGPFPFTAILLLGPGPNKNPATNSKSSISKLQSFAFRVSQLFIKTWDLAMLLFPVSLALSCEHVSEF